MKDQAIVIEALNEAGQIIAEYLEPGPRNAEATLDRLIDVRQSTIGRSVGADGKPRSIKHPVNSPP
jgi:hypothetical protein